MYAEITFPLHAQRRGLSDRAEHPGAPCLFHPPRRREHRRAREPESQRPARRHAGKRARKTGGGSALPPGSTSRARSMQKQVHSADVRIAHAADRSRRSWNPALPATVLSRTSRTSRSRFLWPTACPRCCTTPLPGSSARCTAAGAARWRISSAPPSRRCAPSARTRRTSAPPSVRASAPAASRSDPRSSPRRKPCCMSRSARSCPTAGDRALLDLKRVNALRLTQLGVPAEQIAVSDACTMCRPDVFWSHRATDGRRGVQAAVITL